ncbi:MAG: TAT-variant-translocated molybdopterin oxidoreductase [Planctomycetes bacterium]|nr:TAT-variant-translocated molybdopterin oxidoreductase [Planctomycetota bacterium]
MSRELIELEVLPSTQPAPAGAPLDWSALRERLAAEDGPRFWRSVDELAQTPEFLEYLRREFPRQAGELNDALGRRNFLKLAAASLALAGVSGAGCMRQPEEKIVPYVRQPEEMIPGKPLYYATALTRGGYATGVLVESHLGRPTKIEGNPDHPASLGATDAITQAAILDLYDPDRSQTLLKNGRISTWGDFLTALAAEMAAIRNAHGVGLAILTETITSPALADQLQNLLRDLPEARWYQYEPVNRDNVREGTRLAFGEYVDTVYHFDRARVVVTLDADFFSQLPGSVRYARDFISGRRTHGDPAKLRMNRLYAIESTPGLVGAVADHRWPLKAGNIERLARLLAHRVGVAGVVEPADVANLLPKGALEAMLSDLHANRGASIVIAGDGQPPAVHAIVQAINQALGNHGQTVETIAPVEPTPINQLASLSDLAEQLQSERVKALIVLGGNPVYNAPGELEFATLYQRAPFRVHLSEVVDETSFLSHWHVPAAHELESWGDARAFDGTLTIRQPLIAPLYAGRTPYDVVAALAGHSDQGHYELLRAYYRRQFGDASFEARWQQSIHDGVVADSRAATRQVALRPLGSTLAGLQPASGAGPLELQLLPDVNIWDGRYANNGWLQELPKPLTKLTWDNAALLSPRTAERLGVLNHQLVEIKSGGHTTRAPVWIVPGQPDDSIALALGHGRTQSGRVGRNTGVNAYPLRAARSEWFTADVTVTPTREQYRLSVTQNHHSMEGRNIVEVATLTNFQQQPEFIDEKKRHPEGLPTLYPAFDSAENAWGMAIDQTACIGCNACVVACQAENNIPIVGKEQVDRGREMHWLRIDRYYKGTIENPQTYFQPMACVHCENAPCELVCPVAATVHSAEGLNQMVYNRCVGTRYCANNCPYKVRRFNFLDYQGDFEYDGERSPVMKLMRNPDVTVRSRGVMEKCSYCVQRITAGRIEAEKQNRPIRDGEVVTACQQACPTQAITFGNLRDQSSQVVKRRETPLNYALLAELNTKPRTTYLARVRNPHPSLDQGTLDDTPPVVPDEVDRLRREWAP